MHSLLFPFISLVFQQSERISSYGMPLRRCPEYDGQRARLCRHNDAGKTLPSHEHEERLHLQFVRSHSPNHHPLRHVLWREEPQAEDNRKWGVDFLRGKSSLHTAPLSDRQLRAPTGKVKNKTVNCIV